MECGSVTIGEGGFYFQQAGYFMKYLSECANADDKYCRTLSLRFSPADIFSVCTTASFH